MMTDSSQNSMSTTTPLRVDPMAYFAVLVILSVVALNFKRRELFGLRQVEKHLRNLVHGSRRRRLLVR
jgi:hypothetical protein